MLLPRFFVAKLGFECSNLFKVIGEQHLPALHKVAIHLSFITLSPSMPPQNKIIVHMAET